MDQYGFSLIREQQIQEINSLARIFRHNKTGAQLLSITNDDENKSFGLSFYTPVNDSTGIAHIMEHSVLCGSRKFPLKEPFIELARGSLYTFLNAMTFPDKTLYPIASQNLQDFYNLMDVYLDTAFFPTLAPEVLKQEGWHFELENPDDEMIYKGVVFNEMKGAYATPEEALDNLTKEALFPDTIYSEDSGGNPACIPNLTYANFLEFHKTYYHPSNCITVMYGDDPEEDRLKRLNAYFSEFDEIQPPPPVPLQGEFSEPKHVTGTYPAGQGEGAKSFLTLSWLLPEAINVDLLYGLNLLEEVLLGSSESPLRKVLLDSGLGESLTGSGLSSQFRQMHFSVGLKQIDEANASKVEKLILDTLQELSINGIDAETVEAAFNSIEFAMRENNTGSFPRGLALMIRSLATWNYGGDPLELIAFERHLKSLRSKLSEKGYLEGLIETYFLKNTHRVTTLINPDPNLDGKRAEEEKARLKQIREQLTAAELDQIVQDTHALKLLQETPDSPEALATMPALALKDVERTARQIPIEKSNISGVDLYTHDLFTNGIVYFDLGMDLHVLSAAQLPYISLFGRLLSEAGTEKTDALRFMQRVGKSTGGIHASKTTTPKRNSPQSVAMLFLRGKATPGNTGEMLALMQETLLTVRLDDKERFLQYVQEEKASIESRLAPGGAGYVKSRLMANFSEADWASESTSGLEYLFFLRRLAVEIEADWKGVLATLQQMRSLLVNRAVMVANLTLDTATQSEVLPIVGEFLEAFPGSQSELKTWPSSINSINQGYTIAGQVNHVGTAFNVYDVGYKEHGSIIPITNVLNTLWLWERVRQMGGAYGAGGGLDRMSGTFAFTSYRDPNLTKTLANFKASSEFLRTVEISPRDLERTLVGSAGKLDPYMLPDAKGFTSMMRVLTGVTDADRQQFRNEVFETTMEHLRAFADVLDAGQENAIRAALGPEVNINAANAEQSGLLELVRVL